MAHLEDTTSLVFPSDSEQISTHFYNLSIPSSQHGLCCNLVLLRGTYLASIMRGWSLQCNS